MNNKILCKDGVKRLLTQCIKHEGEWISNEEWLENTESNSLPLFEPLKSLIANKIATGQLVTVARSQANTIQNKARSSN